MQILSTLGLLAVVLPSAFAQYTWTSLVTPTFPSGSTQFIRPYAGYVTNPASTDMRCGPGGTTSFAATANVNANNVVGFKLNQAIAHQGVINVYMAKAVPTAATFDGSGAAWFKVAQLSAVFSPGLSFPAYGLTQFNFVIPSCVPAGEYVIRIEHIALHAASAPGGAQFRVACANVNVVTGGNGNPGPKVAIPGVYSGNEPGIYFNLYYPVPTSYTQPGPPVITC